MTPKMTAAYNLTMAKNILAYAAAKQFGVNHKSLVAADKWENVYAHTKDEAQISPQLWKRNWLSVYLAHG